MCGGYCKLVHLTRTTPTNLCEDSLKFFDEEVRLCFSSCVAIDVPDTQWQQAQLSPKLGGLGLRSLSLHACAAFIFSVASLEMGNPDNTHLQQAILRFNAGSLHRTPSPWNQCSILLPSRSRCLKSWILSHSILCCLQLPW